MTLFTGTNNVNNFIALIISDWIPLGWLIMDLNGNPWVWLAVLTLDDLF